MSIEIRPMLYFLPLMKDDQGVGSYDLSKSVVQVISLHCVPNFMRPWEKGHDTESSSSAFVVDRARR